MNARERDFLEPGASNAFDLIDHRRDWHAPAWAPRRRNDAVAAALLTPCLDPESERSPATGSRRDRRTTRTIARPESFGRRFPHLVDEAILLRIGHDPEHVRQMGDGGGLARRVAAGDDDTRGGIVARDATDRLARALIGGGGDRTGIHDD